MLTVTVNQQRIVRVAPVHWDAFAASNRVAMPVMTGGEGQIMQAQQWNP